MKTGMWHKTNGKNRMIGIMLCWLGMLPACITESADYPPEEEGELQTITFSVDLPQPVEGLSRTISLSDECRLDDVFLLLFDNYTGELIDVYEGINLATQNDNMNIKTFTVDLPIGEGYDILIVGNCRPTVSGANLTKGQTREQVKNALIYQMPAGTWGYTSDRFVPFPIYGEIFDINVTNSVNESPLIPVVRMVSRIDIYVDESILNDDSDKRARLVSVRLYNSNRQGQIIPNSGTYTFEYGQLSVMEPSIPIGAMTSPEPLLYHVEEPGDKLVYTIYTPEALRGSTDGLENTCLVLGLGNKRDEGEGATRADGETLYYYRVDFKDEMSGTLRPLIRNHSYSVIVNSIINTGFPDPDQAYRSKPYGLDYTVKEWELIDIEAGYNGTYRLDISTTFIEIKDISFWGEILISTTHPEGWSAYVSSEPDKIIVPEGRYWLSLDGAYDENEIIWSLDSGKTVKDIPAEKTFALSFEAGYPGVDNGRYVLGYIHIVSGNLTNVITIKRYGWDAS